MKKIIVIISAIFVMSLMVSSATAVTVTDAKVNVEKLEFNSANGILGTIWEFIMMIVGVIKYIIDGIFGLVDLGNTVRQAISLFFDGIQDAIQTVIKGIKDMFKIEIVNMIRALFQMIVDWFKGLFDLIPTPN